jgi:hypothetical protein
VTAAPDDDRVALVALMRPEKPDRNAPRVTDTGRYLQHCDPTVPGRPREKTQRLLAAATLRVAPPKDLDARSYARPTKVPEDMAYGRPRLLTDCDRGERSAAASGGPPHVDAHPRAFGDMIDATSVGRFRRRFAARGREHRIEPHYRRGITATLDTEPSAVHAESAGARLAT